MATATRGSRSLWRNAGVYIALAAVTAAFAVAVPQFRQPSNLLNVLDQSVEIAVVAIGMTAVIITAGIDLSVGSVAALAPFLGAWVITREPRLLFGFGQSASCGVLVCLASGGLVGLVNGAAITKARLPPFIATLGTMSMVRGLAYIVSHGTGITSGLPAGYTATAAPLTTIRMANGATAAVTVGVVLMAVLFVGGHVALTRTRWGRSLYAIGGNETAARLSGLPVDRMLIGVYILAGVLAAVAGLVETGTVGGAVPDAGIDLELNAIAAVVIGGTSLFGGRGSLIGTFAGAVLMRVIRNGLTLCQTDSNWQKVVIGAIVMGAVAFDEYQKQRSVRA